MIRIAVEVLLLAVALVAGYRWSTSRTAPVLAGLQERAAQLEAEGTRLMLLVGNPPCPIAPGRGGRPVRLDPDTPLDDLPEDYGADHVLRPGCCEDCDDELDTAAAGGRS